MHHNLADQTTLSDSQHSQILISVYIITLNEEQQIGRALDSVQWADEIIVVDSGSTDGTLEICEKKGARVEYRKFDDFVTQKNYALSLCTGKWALNIDADEEVSMELAESIRHLTDDDTNTTPIVFGVYRRTWYLGRWILHCGWYPEIRMRISRLGKALWAGSYLHERLEPEKGGETRLLSGDLFHRPYRNINHHMSKIALYTDMWSEREASNGRVVHVWDILMHPVGKFLKMYILKRGFLDGVPGLIVSLFGAYYTFMKYVKLWEKMEVSHG